MSPARVGGRPGCPPPLERLVCQREIQLVSARDTVRKVLLYRFRVRFVSFIVPGVSEVLKVLLWKDDINRFLKRFYLGPLSRKQISLGTAYATRDDRTAEITALVFTLNCLCRVNFRQHISSEIVWCATSVPGQARQLVHALKQQSLTASPADSFYIFAEPSYDPRAVAFWARCLGSDELATELCRLHRLAQHDEVNVAANDAMLFINV